MNLDHLLASLGVLYEVQPAEKTYSGIIIALEVPQGMAAHHAVEGGLDPKGFHVTLAFLGNVQDHADALPFLRLAAGLHALAGHTAPIEAHFGGTGRFLGVDSGKGACYLSVDGADLPPLREQCFTLAQQCGLPPDTTHGFSPHVTVAYTDPDAPHPTGSVNKAPFLFRKLGLWIGGHRVNFPFRGGVTGALGAVVDFHFGQAEFAKADVPPANAQREAQTLLAQLGGDLARLDQQDSQMRQHAQQKGAAHRQMFDRMAQAIPAPRGSALEEAALHHAEEAARAERVGGIA